MKLTLLAISLLEHCGETGEDVFRADGEDLVDVHLDEVGQVFEELGELALACCRQRIGNIRLLFPILRSGRATGYRTTIVAGEVTWEDGEPTGALPGKLVRGAQAAPSR